MAGTELRVKPRDLQIQMGELAAMTRTICRGWSTKFHGQVETYILTCFKGHPFGMASQTILMPLAYLFTSPNALPSAAVWSPL